MLPSVDRAKYVRWGIKVLEIRELSCFAAGLQRCVERASWAGFDSSSGEWGFDSLNRLYQETYIAITVVRYSDGATGLGSECAAGDSAGPLDFIAAHPDDIQFVTAGRLLPARSSMTGAASG